MQGVENQAQNQLKCQLKKVIQVLPSFTTTIEYRSESEPLLLGEWEVWKAKVNSTSTVVTLSRSQ